MLMQMSSNSFVIEQKQKQANKKIYVDMKIEFKTQL